MFPVIFLRAFHTIAVFPAPNLHFYSRMEIVPQTFTASSVAYRVGGFRALNTFQVIMSSSY